MWYNPATWTTVDQIQNSLSSDNLTNSLVEGAQYTQPTSTNTLPVSEPGGSVLGATYYDTNTGSMQQYDGNGQYSDAYASDGNSAYTAPDPYAQWGGQAMYNSLINASRAKKEGINSSAGAAGDAYAGKYQRSIMDFLDSGRLGQQAVDRKGQNVELAKMQGVGGIMNMVGRGIRSGNVMLGNKNAGDSSAAGAIANAYGEIGRGEMANVGNQYALGNQEVADMQDSFNVQQASGVRNLQGGKEDTVNSIVNDARSQLVALDAEIAQASLPERIAIEQEKEAIKQAILGKLQSFDQQLTSGVSNIQAQTGDQRRMRAGEMQRAGTDLGADAFRFSDQAPMQWQGIQPAGGALPLFTIPRGRREG